MRAEPPKRGRCLGKTGQGPSLSLHAKGPRAPPTPVRSVALKPPEGVSAVAAQADGDERQVT